MSNRLYDMAREVGRLVRKPWDAYMNYINVVTLEEEKLTQAYLNERKKSPRNRGLKSLVGLL